MYMVHPGDWRWRWHLEFRRRWTECAVCVAQPSKAKCVVWLVRCSRHLVVFVKLSYQQSIVFNEMKIIVAYIYNSVSFYAKLYESSFHLFFPIAFITLHQLLLAWFLLRKDVDDLLYSKFFSGLAGCKFRENCFAARELLKLASSSRKDKLKRKACIRWLSKI